MREGDVTREAQADSPRAVVSNFNRDISLAAGTQAVTGLGFKPTAIVAIGSVLNLNPRVSVGFASYQTDLTTVSSVLQHNIYNDTWDATGALTGYYVTGGPLTRTYGILQSYDSDGFTINWTKNGSPTGTLSTYFIAFP